MLKIQFKDHRKPAMWLVDSSLRIGRALECDIVVDDAQAAEIHCQLKIDHEDITLINLSQNKSIFVNDVPVAKTHQLVAWDIIRIGDTELEIVDPLQQQTRPLLAVQSNKTVIRSVISAWMLKANSSPLAGQFFPVNDAFTIGRDESADIVVPLSFVSRIHAKLVVKRDKLFIQDLGSSNGTFVNGGKIRTSQLENGDEVKLDKFSFSVVGPETKEKEAPGTKSKKKIKPTKISKETAGISETVLASQKVFLHDIGPTSTGKIYEIVRRVNHLSKMLGHHISTSQSSVSARHIHLNEQKIGWEVVNNGASDGLLINNKMQIQAILQDGDEITVGGTRLKFQSRGEVPLNYFTPASKKSFPVKGIVFVVVIVVVALISIVFDLL